MHQTPGSPISPIEPVSSTPPKAKVSVQATVQSLDDRKGSWLPFTFRWYFLLIPTTVSLGLAITISLLIWYSQSHSGLGADDGSSGILFGWRFTPTLLAVLYTQLTVILFVDAKRTEPFARLAKAPSDGASACGTILQAPRAWWNVFGDVFFRRKKTGKTSWCLVICALINTMAALVISPLSSAFLTSEEVVITKPLEFNRIVPRAETQLPMVANRETYFRTMSALMRNISTSAWITDKSLTLPFWPSTGKAHLGPDLGSSYNSWATEATVLHADYGCQNMTLESADLVPRPFSAAYDVLGHGPYNGTQPMVSFELTSDDGCRYELSIHPAVDLANAGGLTWSNTSTYFPVLGEVLPIGTMPFFPNVSSSSPYARLNVSKECRDRDIIILSTPWTKVYPRDLSQGPWRELNKTYERSPDFRMKALLCESQYSLEKRNVTTTLSKDQEPVFTFGQNDNAERRPITNALINITEFEKTTLHDNWANYFNSKSVSTDADRALGGYSDPNANQSNSGRAPGFSGVGPLLGSLYSFNIIQMLDDKDFANQAARVKGRFFTENLRETLANPAAVETSALKGEAAIVEERIMVIRETGIALAVLFLVSSLLLCLVFCVSRISFRPLDLETDPGSTIGHAALLRSQLARSSIFRIGHQATRPDFHHALKMDTFYTLNGSLRLHNNQSSEISSPKSAQSGKSWHPLIIRLRMLFALFCFLIMILTAVLVLNAFSAQSRLSQLAFLYEADVSKFGLSVSTFAPISIAPTVVSIAIGLWWGELDTTFRTLQPYISMSGRPTPIRTGAGLTYRSKTWVGAAIKAARNKHWILFMIAMGSVLCQTLTVSMSALFERRADNVSRQIILERSLESRQIPIIYTVQTKEMSEYGLSKKPVMGVLNQLLLNPPKSWIPGATIQLSLNGTKLAWTHDDWSFIPLELSGISTSSSIQPASKDAIMHDTNVTVATSALRARLECSQIPEVANSSTWIKHPENDMFYEAFDLEGLEDYYVFNKTMFDHTPSNTTVFTTNNMIRCCSNETTNTPGTAAIGYWSPVDALDFPIVDQWPFSFVTKWIVGKPRTRILDAPSGRDSPILYFEELPQLQAAQCVPIIEAAEASVLVDKDTGMVQSYEITGSVKPTQSTWSDVFVHHQLTNGNGTQHFNGEYSGPINMTTSYGVLFLGSMFKAANGNIDDTSTIYDWESLTDNAFVMRDREHGLNMDLMTYSMYSLANKDPQALLDYATLVKHADLTFQTFFQHFIANGLSLDEGGLAYQEIGDTSMDALGVPVGVNGTQFPQLEQSYPNANTNRTVEASVSNRIQILHLNSVATYLSVAILIWLIGTAAIVTILQRKYTSGMIQDVQLIADVLVLVAGSDNLLQLIHERGVELKKDDEVKTMLGWFKDRDGEVRWGIEVVGGRNAVEWVDAPKTGNHIREKSPSGVSLLPWRRN